MITRNTLKKVLIWVLLLALMIPTMVSMAPETYAYATSTMYVKTSNGKSIKVRSEPNKNSSSIGQVGYGDEVEVDWSYAGNDGWSRILVGAAGHPYGYLQTRYLVYEKPEPYQKPTKAPATPKPTKDPKKEAEDLKKKQAELNKELKSEKEVEPFYIAVRPTRSTGWVNFRVGPSTITTKITSYPANKELIVLAETTHWYRAKDPETGKVGYISKSLTVKLNKALATEEANDGSVKLGRLTVNGEFELTCQLPADYKLQVVEVRGESIIASITSDDITKPRMYLSIAFDELYADVDRMNDLSEEDMEVLKGTYSSMNDVVFEERMTGMGTKLLVVREVGSDTDFVDFLSIYKGYVVEFNMTPNPNSAVQELTDEQIDMAIQFLTDVLFVPVQK